MKKAKLAALHKWTHIHPGAPESLALLQDDLLKVVMRKSDKGPVRTARPKSPAPLDSVPDSDQGSNQDEMASEPPGSDEEELEKEYKDSDSSDDDFSGFSRTLGKRRKVTHSAANGKLREAKPREGLPDHVDSIGSSKRYDLMEMAAHGGAGNVTFILEKVSDSQL